MIDLRPLIHPSFWLDIHPMAFNPGSQRVLFIVFAVLLVVGAIIRMVAGRRSEDRHVTEVFNRVGRMGVTMGILGLVLFFCSFEEVVLLGSRVWYLVWAAGLLVWVAGIVRYVKKIVPAERAEALAEAERRKYLPGITR